MPSPVVILLELDENELAILMGIPKKYKIISEIIEESQEYHETNNTQIEAIKGSQVTLIFEADTDLESAWMVINNERIYLRLKSLYDEQGSIALKDLEEVEFKIESIKADMNSIQKDILLGYQNDPFWGPQKGTFTIAFLVF